MHHHTAVDLSGEGTTSNAETNVRVTPPTRIYLSRENIHSSDVSSVFIGGRQYQPSIVVGAETRFTELIWDADVDEGLYNVVMAVNMNHLNIDRIDSISITQSGGALEIFTGEELRRFADSSKKKMLLLGLHRQFLKRGDEELTFNVELRTLDTTRNNPGYLLVNYMELYPSQSNPVASGDKGAVFMRHEPFLWSIDVTLMGGITDPTTSVTPVRIIHYSVSRDGNYVATLSTNGRILQLDMWDLELHSHSEEYKDEFNETRAPFVPNSCGQHRISFSNEGNSDLNHLKWILQNPRERISVSVSHDASKVALMCLRQDSLLRDTFQ
ncbi:hypothetical protein BGX31_000488, partial [Mortierella sp. GBA43]